MRRSLVSVQFVVLLCAGCAEPPSKEMNQAQGAIDAARAAGADEYATADLTAAVDALRRSEEAVGQNDYRLALSLAIDARARAQQAAKAVVEARAKARGDAERAVAEVDTLLSQARTQLDDPDLPPAVRRSLRGPRAQLAATEKTMQEARTALKADDYSRVIALTKGQVARVQAALTSINDAVTAHRGRRRG